jgi:uncharacterized protein YlzI (FlbEa/FlbD family)
MNNFIKLNGPNDKKIIVNPTFIESIVENDNGSIINMSFGGTSYRVNESTDEVLKLIEKNKFFKTTTF